jgi:hypothetical protein
MYPFIRTHGKTCRNALSAGLDSDAVKYAVDVKNQTVAIPF